MKRLTIAAIFAAALAASRAAVADSPANLLSDAKEQARVSELWDLPPPAAPAPTASDKS